MIAGDVCIQDWRVNATGDTSTSWDFFTIYRRDAHPETPAISETKSVTIVPDRTNVTVGTVSCQLNNSVWVDCSVLHFGDMLTAVRANCTGVNSEVDTATFTVENVYDEKQFVSGEVLAGDGAWWTLDGINTTLLDSGQWRLTATCIDNETNMRTKVVDWTLPWGRLDATVIAPLDGSIVYATRLFNLTANVVCTGGECGNVSVTAQHKSLASPVSYTYNDTTKYSWLDASQNGRKVNTGLYQVSYSSMS